MRRLIKVLPLITAITSLSGCEKYALDRQMDELCKKDGGIKIYETVKLPRDMFDQSGNVISSTIDYNGTKALNIANEYVMTGEVFILKNGDPLKGEGRLSRIHSTIARIADGKILSEVVEYSRAAGDGFYIGHPTQAICPANHIDFVRSTFSNQ